MEGEPLDFEEELLDSEEESELPLELDDELELLLELDDELELLSPPSPESEGGESEGEFEESEGEFESEGELVDFSFGRK